MLIKKITYDDYFSQREAPVELPIYEIDSEKKIVMIGFNPREDHRHNTASKDYIGSIVDIIGDDVYLFNNHYYKRVRIIDGDTNYIIYNILMKHDTNTHICQCADCGVTYAVSAREYYWFESRGFKPPTALCKDCRRKRKLNK